MEVSLIPKEQKKQALPRFTSFSGPKLSLNFASKIGLVLLLVSIGVGIYLWMWQRSFDREHELLNEELRTLSAQRDMAVEKRLANLNILLNSLEDLIGSHRYWSNFFIILEEKTVPAINFISFDGNYGEATVSLRGLSPNYTSIARQIRALEEVNGIERVEAQQIKVNKEGFVEFTMNVVINKKILTGI